MKLRTIEILMRKLDIKIPEFRLSRWAQVQLEGEEVKVEGIDKLGGPFDIFKEKSHKMIDDTELDFEMPLK